MERSAIAIIFMPITLTLSGISVTFTRFLDTDRPRVQVQKAAVEYSTFGTPAIGGASWGPPKHLWTIHAPIDPDSADILRAIAWEFDYLRRNQLPCDILIYDTTQTIVEKAPRSRAICPGCVETPVASSFTSYFAQFKAGITENPKFSELGIVDSVTLTLAETILV